MSGRLTRTPPAAADTGDTSTELVPVRQQLKALESSGALGRALPTGLSAQRFTRIILTELSKNPELEECTVPSVLGAVMTAAQLGLEFGPLGHAYLVPFRDNKTNTRKCQLIVGYRGMIDLARRTGLLRSIVARPIHEGDHFEFAYGSEERIVHRPPLTGDRGPVIAYYGVAQLADGGQVMHVMSRADVERFRRRSPTQREAPSGPWTTDFDAMACKTVIRRMWPWLPSTVEAAQAIESDEAVINWTGTEAVVIEASSIDTEPADQTPAVDTPPAAAELPPADPSGTVIDLMGALEASIERAEAAKAERP